MNGITLPSVAMPRVLFADRSLTAYDTPTVLDPGSMQVISVQEGILCQHTRLKTQTACCARPSVQAIWKLPWHSTSQRRVLSQSQGTWSQGRKPFAR